MLNLIQIEAQ